MKRCNQSVYLDALEVKEMGMKTTVADYNQSLILEATTTVIRGNEYFNYTQQTTVHEGTTFCEFNNDNRFYCSWGCFGLA